jgi:hypothetical protein
MVCVWERMLGLGISPFNSGRRGRWRDPVESKRAENSQWESVVVVGGGYDEISRHNEAIMARIGWLQDRREARKRTRKKQQTDSTEPYIVWCISLLWW